MIFSAGTILDISCSELNNQVIFSVGTSQIYLYGDPGDLDRFVDGGCDSVDCLVTVFIFNM